MNKPSPSEKVSAEINAVRLANGWDGKICTMCCRLARSPYRAYDEMGRVVQGCIDSSHEGQLVQISESNRWHHRPEALAMRRETRDKLRAYGRAANALARQGYMVARAIVGGAQ